MCSLAFPGSVVADNLRRQKEEPMSRSKTLLVASPPFPNGIGRWGWAPCWILEWKQTSSVYPESRANINARIVLYSLQMLEPKVLFVCLFLERTPACISEVLSHVTLQAPPSLFYSRGKTVECSGLRLASAAQLLGLHSTLNCPGSGPVLIWTHSHLLSVPSLHLILDPVPFSLLWECSAAYPLPVFTWIYLERIFSSFFINHKHWSLPHLHFSLSLSLPSSLHFSSYSSSAVFPPFSLRGQAPYEKPLLDRGLASLLRSICGLPP